MSVRSLSRIALVLLISAPALFSQTPAPTKKTPTSDAATEQAGDSYKIDTNLVTIPVIASTRSGSYVADLRKEDFSIFEDGVRQEVAFFATVNAPFHVVLTLDTSASTQEKLDQIQAAAIAFVEQLQPEDRVKVISFDDQVRDLNEFTSDKAILRAAIKQTKPGRNTKLYDAMELSLNALRSVKGRKAIVLFTDGVDWHSDRAVFDDALRGLDESGIIVYPIRYDTRSETEQLARKQAQEQEPALPTIDVIRKTPPGTTPPTFPGGESLPIPSGPDKSGGLTRLPPPSVILDQTRGGGRQPDVSPPRDDRIPDIHPTPRTPPNFPGDPTPRTKPRSDSDANIKNELDQLYAMADSYLLELANRSGGRVARADTLRSLPDAFKNIAAELRTQYSLGYYPANKSLDGSYRKIQVKTARKDIAVRAKPGYRARSGG